MNNFWFTEHSPEKVRFFVRDFLEATKGKDILRPFTSIHEEYHDFLQKRGFKLHSTKQDTILVSDQREEIFLKVFIPLKLKRKIKHRLINPAKTAFAMSEKFRRKGVPLVKVFGYGKIKRKDAYVMAGARGRNFLEIVKEEKNIQKIELFFFKIIDVVCKIHGNSYFLGDANIKHFFFEEDRVDSIIDLDGFSQAKFLKEDRFARDLGYLFRPILPFDKAKIKDFVFYYCSKISIDKKEEFLKKVENYRIRRWKIKDK